MKAVLMSIKPKWCEKIFSGEKTVEVRKTQLATPFKVYVYETKTGFIEAVCGTCPICAFSRGKVIGEFVCDRVIKYGYDVISCAKFKWRICERRTCLSAEEMYEYSNGKTLYGWHITEPKLYDKPKALSEFYRRLPDKVLEEGNYDCRKDRNMVCIDYPEMSDLCDYCIFGGRVQLTRPPQSWCYVEEIEE